VDVANEDDLDDAAEAPFDGAKAIAAAVIAAGGSFTEAGTASGRTKRTMVRWMADPAFARYVADLRAERVSEVTGLLAELAPRAVQVMADSLSDEDPSVRLRAAHLALDWSVRLRRATDLDARILEVERRQGIRSDTAADDESPNS
jgi:hypothetical protein